MDLAQTLQRTRLALDRCVSRRMVGETTVAMLAEAIAADVVSFDEIDLRRGWMFGINNASTPGAERLFPVFVRHARQHPIVTRFLLGADSTALRLEDVTTPEEFERTDLYQHFYAQFGIRHQMIAPVGANRDALVSVSAFRSQSAFSDADVATANRMLPLVQAAWSAAVRIEDSQRSAFRQMGYESVALKPGFGGPPVSEAARRLLTSRWGQNGLDTQLEAWKRAMQHEASNGGLAPRMWSDPSGVEIRAIRLPDNEPAMAVRIGASTAELPTNPAWTKLSAREREVAEWLVEGKTNDEIASILKVTESTIRKHLEHIFAKLSVGNRATAVRVLLAGSPEQAK